MLDIAYQRLHGAHCDVASEMRALVRGLGNRRNQSKPQEWEHWVENNCLKHPLREIIHQDPFTARAFSKPRGYPGDAVLLDYIYRAGASVGSEGIAAQIHHYTTNAPAPCAVRYRRDLLTKRIDEIAKEFTSPHILSLAAGHLREVELSAAVHAGRIGRFIAVDQDAESLATITKEYGHFGIEAICASVKDVLSGKLAFSGFHFVYAAGLFDYLPDPVAKRLARRMMRMLLPGGRILIANFLPDIEDVGYMESFMNWHLIFRTEKELLNIFCAIPCEEISKIDLLRDPNDNIAFAEVCRSYEGFDETLQV